MDLLRRQYVLRTRPSLHSGDRINRMLASGLWLVSMVLLVDSTGSADLIKLKLVSTSSPMLVPLIDDLYPFFHLSLTLHTLWVCSTALVFAVSAH